MSDDPNYPRIDVYGSLDELERDFGVRPTDLHRPGDRRADPAQPGRPDRASRSMRRVPEVLDCWFESGSMPFAQVHYPFENRDWFDSHYPGDFIVEYIGQTRGWFYTLHVLATALFDRPSFRTCVSHGIVLGNDGRKMSKSLRNYPDVNEVFDTLRFRRDALVPDGQPDPARRQPGRHRAGHPRGRAAGAAAAVELVLLLRAVRQRGEPHRRPLARHGQRHVLDRYILAKTKTAVEQIGGGARRLRHRRRLPGAPRLPGAADQLVHPPVAVAVLGGRRGGPRHALDRPRDGHARRRAAAADDRRDDLARPDRRRQRAPGGLAGRRRLAVRRRARGHDGPDPRTSAAPRSACARPASSGSGCRWRR